MVKAMTRFFAIILALAILVGCGASKNIPTEVVKDSVVVVVNDRVVYRDTTIFVEVPVEVEKEILPADDTSHLETSLAVSDAWLSAGQLHHSLRHKSTTIVDMVEVPEHFRDSVVLKVVEKTITEKVEVEKELSSWQQFRMTLGTIAVISIVSWLVFVLLKKLL